MAAHSPTPCKPHWMADIALSTIGEFFEEQPNTTRSCDPIPVIELTLIYFTFSHSPPVKIEILSLGKFQLYCGCPL